MGETRTVHDPFLGQDVQISDRLVDRLRGKYASGPHMPNGKPEFGWKQFQAPPIQHEAADEISRLTEENERLRKVADDKLGDFYLEAWEVAADALHKELLLQVEHLMDSKEGTPAAQRLSYLAELVGAYEEARFGVEE